MLMAFTGWISSDPLAVSFPRRDISTLLNLGKAKLAKILLGKSVHLGLGYRSSPFVISGNLQAPNAF